MLIVAVPAVELSKKFSVLNPPTLLRTAFAAVAALKKSKVLPAPVLIVFTAAEPFTIPAPSIVIPAVLPMV